MSFNIRRAYNTAREIIRDSARIAVDLRNGADRPDLRASSSNKTIEGLADLVTRADIEVQESILQKLIKHKLNTIPLNAEEKPRNSRARNFPAKGDYKWTVDPIDGTLNYKAGTKEKSIRKLLESAVSEFGNPAEHLRPNEWGTMIGLSERLNPIFGVIYIPDEDSVYHSRINQKAYVNKDGNMVEVRAAEEDEFKTTDIIFVNSELYGPLPKTSLTVRRHGSYAYMCTRIASGESIGIISKKPKLYDIVAPICIVRGAGGVVLDEKGKNATLNSKFFIFGPNVRYVSGMLHFFRETFGDDVV